MQKVYIVIVINQGGDLSKLIKKGKNFSENQILD